MYRVMTILLSRVAQRLPRAAIATALNFFPGLFPPDVSAALADAIPNSLPIGPYHLIPGAASAAVDDPRGCLPWLDHHPAGSVLYVSFGTAVALQPDELHELALGLEDSGAPFLWSLREESWRLLPPGFKDRAVANGSGLLVPWTPQAAVLQHEAVAAFVTHAGWGAVVEAMTGGVPMLCRPFFGDQMMNARTVEHMWGFGKAFDRDNAPMKRSEVTVAVASLLKGEDGARMRARARELQAMVTRAFEPDGGSTGNFRKLVDIVCAPANPA
jgi:anthocyanidin 3-O-glucosyltransferase